MMKKLMTSETKHEKQTGYFRLENRQNWVNQREWCQENNWMMAVYLPRPDCLAEVMTQLRAKVESLLESFFLPLRHLRHLVLSPFRMRVPMLMRLRKRRGEEVTTTWKRISVQRPRLASLFLTLSVALYLFLSHLRF